MHHQLTFLRGAEEKMDLSLVDKIELGRAYQPITGTKSILKAEIHPYLLVFSQMKPVFVLTPLRNMANMWTH